MGLSQSRDIGQEGRRTARAVRAKGIIAGRVYERRFGPLLTEIPTELTWRAEFSWILQCISQTPYGYSYSTLRSVQYYVQECQPLQYHITLPWSPSAWEDGPAAAPEPDRRPQATAGMNYAGARTKHNYDDGYTKDPVDGLTVGRNERTPSGFAVSVRRADVCEIPVVYTGSPPL